MPSESSDPSDWSGHAQNVDSPHRENHLIFQGMGFLNDDPRKSQALGQSQFREVWQVRADLPEKHQLSANKNIKEE